MKTVAEKKAKQRERSILSIMATCIHFNGIQHDSCRAGVKYHEQFGEGAGCFANIACQQSYKNEKFPMKTCPHVSYPNHEVAEAKQNDRDMSRKRGMHAMLVAHADAAEKGLGKGNGGTGEVKCPICLEGMIRYSVASVNGHMHAGCTAGCVNWME